MTFRVREFAFLAVLLFVGVARAALPPAVEGPQGQTPMPSLAPMLDRVVPAVVNVSTTYTQTVRNPLAEDPFFQWFFGQSPGFKRRYQGRSVGSGVILDAANVAGGDANKGYVLTNFHVVNQADEITITLADGRTLKAELVGADDEVDLAVLSVEPTGLRGVPLADSAQVKVGDFVVAIGNPFGLGQSVSSGIVSALGRSGLSIEGYEDFIQTDASINPGNSGGALVNLRGELVGINTAIYGPNGGSVGIGFAIPANMVRAIMNQLVRFGEVRRGHIGIVVQELNADLARAFAVDQRKGGALVAEVESGSAAERAGIEPGDVIVRMGERAVRRPADYHARAAVLMLGDSLPVIVLRNGAQKSLTLQLRADADDKTAGERVSPLLGGVLLQNYRSSRDGKASAGVLITDVSPDSLANAIGLRPGDIIVSANERASQNIQQLREGATANQRQLLLRIFRDGQYYFVPMRR